MEVGVHPLLWFQSYGVQIPHIRRGSVCMCGGGGGELPPPSRAGGGGVVRIHTYAMRRSGVCPSCEPSSIESEPYQAFLTATVTLLAPVTPSVSVFAFLFGKSMGARQRCGKVCTLLLKSDCKNVRSYRVLQLITLSFSSVTTTTSRFCEQRNRLSSCVIVMTPTWAYICMPIPGHRHQNFLRS